MITYFDFEYKAFLWIFALNPPTSPYFFVLNEQGDKDDFEFFEKVQEIQIFFQKTLAFLKGLWYNTDCCLMFAGLLYPDKLEAHSKEVSSNGKV